MKEPEKVVKFIDWLYSDEGADLTNFGKEGTDYTKQGDEYVISQDLVDAHMNDSDPWRGYMGSLGTGQLGMALYIDSRTSLPFYSDEVLGWYKFWGSDENMDDVPFAEPQLSKDETSRIAELTTAVDTMFVAEIDKFIMGTRPISEYDAFAAKMKAAGADEMEEIYNAAARVN